MNAEIPWPWNAVLYFVACVLSIVGYELIPDERTRWGVILMVTSLSIIVMLEVAPQ